MVGILKVGLFGDGTTAVPAMAKAHPTPRLPTFPAIAAILACAVALASCGSSGNTMTSPSTLSKCAVTVDVPGTTIPAAGGNGSITVQTERECQWTAQPESSWLSITAGSTGQGPGAVQFAIAANADPAVVAEARKGSEAAYRELLTRYERPVFSLIFRMVRDRETAEDLAQETFIKVLNNLDRYSPEFKFSSWLFKIANNLTIDHLRRRRVDTISIEGAPDAVTAESARATSIAVVSAGESPLEELESKELGTAIERAIGKLRPEYRACIMLRHVEDKSYEEIAEIVKLPLGTVKTYIHRARHELRNALGEVR